MASEVEIVEQFLEGAKQLIKAKPNHVPVNPIYAMATVGWLRQRLQQTMPPPPQEEVAPRENHSEEDPQRLPSVKSLRL
jgi:hypothetical protein